MKEDEIAIRFDRRKLDALKVALYAEGEDLDQSLEKYIDKLYADKVPKNERAKIERQIQEEIKAEQEKQDRFIAVRLTDGEETICFTASGSNSFYCVAGQLKDMLKEADDSTLDSLLEYFIDAYVIMERKAPRILTDSYTVGDVIVLTEKEYFSLYNNLLRDRDYFEERKHMDYDSILILGEGQKDGILVDTQGYSYARYAALVPFARLLVDEHMKELTDYVIGKVKSGEGNIQKITYAELEERFGTSLTPENGFCKLLAEELKQRKEFDSVAFYSDGLRATLRSYLRDSEQSVPEREETEETLGTVQGM